MGEPVCSVVGSCAGSGPVVPVVARRNFDGVLGLPVLWVGGEVGNVSSFQFISAVANQQASH